jgi:hypothetical protein
MRGIEEPVIFPVFKGRGKIVDVERSRQVFQGIVEISGVFRIVADKNMVVVGAGWMKENSGGHKLRGTAAQMAEVNFPGMGKRDPVRQLKKAG